MPGKVVSWGLVLAIVSCQNSGPRPKSADGQAGKAAEVTKGYLPKGAPTIRDSVSDQTAARVIEQYVTKSRSWARNEYWIEEKGREGSNVRYWIVHLDDASDERSRWVGGGKSFAVDYDPQRQEVVKEWAFQ